MFFVLIGIGRLLGADYRRTDNQLVPYRSISRPVCVVMDPRHTLQKLAPQTSMPDF